MRKVTVKPKSEQSLDYFVNIMERNPICNVEEDKGDGMVLLSSANGKHIFWVNINDEWECDWWVI